MTPKMVPKWGPNRIFDAEALRDPLEDLLERSWTLLEPKKVILESLLAALGGLSRQVWCKKGVQTGTPKRVQNGTPSQDSSKSSARGPRIDFRLDLEPVWARFPSHFGAILSAESGTETREQSTAQPATAPWPVWARMRL